MKRRITTIIILLSIILLALAMFHGIEFGKVKILSISQIKEKNESLDAKIEKASTLTSIDYPEKIQTLQETFEEYMIEKEKYEELSGISSDKVENIYETKKYDISYLWRVLGKMAEKRSVSIGMDVQKNNAGNSSYNLAFTIAGEYVNIIQFITDLENESDLYFRIYDFNVSGSGTKITATFVVKNINIEESTIKAAQDSTLNNIQK